MVVIKPIKNNPAIMFMDKVCKNHKPFYIEKIADGFYRGSEPNAQQIKDIAQKGVKTILNLKSLTSKQLEIASKEAEKNGLKYINIPLNIFRVKKSFPYIMETISQASKDNPLFIHCTYGRDRTGFVSALINYFKNGFTMKDSIKDMIDHGSTNPLFLNLKRYLKMVDKQIKKASTEIMH